MRASTFCVAVSVTAVLSATCGQSTPAPSPTLNVAGTWSGTVGLPMSGTALRLTWVATQAGTFVTGPATLIKPGANVPGAGTLNATLSGNRLTLTYVLGAGTVLGFDNCTISGSGSATVTDTTMTGDLSLTFASCSGSGLEPTGSPQLALNQQ